ncbi:MAG TPA: YkgJ family cysteine cluster protein [Dehalococcoidia bacterium]|nr:YkgJ family cysteine cluster protein [Dehalococcoidia bacterium]
MRVRLSTAEGKEVEYDPARGGLEPWPEMPCLRCGLCCTRWQPEIDADELKFLAQGLGLHLEAVRRQYVQEHPYKPGIYFIKRQSGACIFLSRQGDLAACTVHPFRPQACRDWTPSPFRPECREGLRRRWQTDKLVGIEELSLSHDELANLYRSLRSS